MKAGQVGTGAGAAQETIQEGSEADMEQKAEVAGEQGLHSRLQARLSSVKRTVTFVAGIRCPDSVGCLDTINHFSLKLSKALSLYTTAVNATLRCLQQKAVSPTA